MNSDLAYRFLLEGDDDLMPFIWNIKLILLRKKLQKKPICIGGVWFSGGSFIPNSYAKTSSLLLLSCTIITAKIFAFQL